MLDFVQRREWHYYKKNKQKKLQSTFKLKITISNACIEVDCFCFA